MPSRNDGHLREADHSLTVYFSLGYKSVTASLLRALSKQFIPVRLHQKPVRIGFMHFREPARKLLNTNDLSQHLEIVLHLGQRFKSSPGGQ
jgi:hypothetical protein